MLNFIRDEIAFLVLIGLWVMSTLYLGPIIYALLPLSVFLLRGREQFAEILFGFLMVLVLSDLDPMFVPMRKIKTAKYAMMIALSLIVLIDRRRFIPLSGIFGIFLPFFVYAFFPLMRSSDPIVGFSKTTSYALLYLVVPNYVLYNFRQQGWDFFRNLIYFILTLLVASYVFMYINPRWVSIAGRYRGFFGNPNGLGIFTFLSFMLAYIATHMKRDLFPLYGRILVLAVIAFFLVKCGSRTSLTATVMFLLFSRVFSLSPFLGFVAFLIFIAGIELVASNLSTIVIALGLEKYFRLETLDDGSGRYFAWQFAWQKINEGGHFLFGAGFGNDEWVMRHNYAYLRTQGHHGGVHNSYLTMWFNAGIMGLLIYFRSFVLMFVKANKRVPLAFGVMVAVMFSVLYESWLTGSLNPFSILLLVIMTMLTEDEIVESVYKEAEAEGVEEQEVTAAGEEELVWRPVVP